MRSITKQAIQRIATIVIHITEERSKHNMSKALEILLGVVIVVLVGVVLIALVKPDGAFLKGITDALNSAICQIKW